MELTIIRSEWIRGEYWSSSKMLRSSDNKRCCLGFYLKTCGLSDQDLKDINSPNFLSSEARVKLMNSHGKWLLPHLKASFLTPDGTALVKANDDVGLSKIPIGESKREVEIKAIFAKNDVEVNFVD